MQILILGFDAFDPARFECLSGEGKQPNLTGYADSGGYAPLEVATTPQTKVSWTSMATGLDPGGHGLFDFVHRDPATYTPYVSLLPVQRKVFGTQFVPPFKTRTIFEEVAQDGFPATALWWPATFPAQPDALARTIPVLGTPDIRGRVGVGTLFSKDGDLSKPKTPVSVLIRKGRDRFSGSLRGPVIRKRRGVQESAIELELNLREGMLASIFDSLDRVQHMFWRDRPDIVDEWYVKLDALVGEAVRFLAKPEQGDIAPPTHLSKEDQEIVEERLQGLGYL